MGMFDFDNTMKWLNWLKGLPFTIGLLVVFLVFFGLLLFKPEVLMRLRTWILSLILWTGTFAKKKHIESYINANILKIAKEATKEIDDVIPYDLKIKWVTGSNSNRESFIKENNVVVCVDNKKNKMHTIVHAVNDYVKNGLLAKERHCIDKKVFKSSCLVMTRKLLLETYEKGITYFFEDIVEKEKAGDKELEKSINKLINLDENGMFVQIMLRELKEKSNLVFGKVDNTAFINETKKFIDFLYEIATRDNGDDSTPLEFKGNYYKIGIILVAKPNTYQLYGESSYIERFKQHVIEGKDSVYLCARNDKIRIAKKVLKELNNLKYIRSYKIKYKKELPYKGRGKDGSIYEGISIHIKLEKKKKNKAEKIA